MTETFILFFTSQNKIQHLKCFEKHFEGGQNMVCCINCSTQKCKDEEKEWSQQDTECVLQGGSCQFQNMNCFGEHFHFTKLHQKKLKKRSVRFRNFFLSKKVTLSPSKQINIRKNLNFELISPESFKFKRCISNKFICKADF